MIYDNNLLKQAKCSSKDKQKLSILIERLVLFSETARREGLLALEDGFDEIHDPFLLQAIQFVVDGVDPYILRTILYTKIYYGGHYGLRLLAMIIAAEGVLSIQCGDNPIVLLYQLCSLLGDEGETIKAKIIKKHKIDPIISSSSREQEIDLKLPPEISSVRKGPLNKEEIQGLLDKVSDEGKGGE